MRAPAMIAVTIGEAHSCAISESREAYCWGSGSYGQLGTGLTQSSRFARLVSGNQKFTFIDAGARHTCAITDRGEAFCWGANESGQLGLGNDQPAHAPSRVSTTALFIRLSAGSVHTCGVTTDNRALCWGNDEQGQLGNGARVGIVVEPDSVATPLRFTEISAGKAHTCAVSVNGAALCWGANQFAQLGNGTHGVNAIVPSPVGRNIVFRNVSAGWSHSCGTTPQFVGYCWGSNSFGEIGNANPSDFDALPDEVLTYGTILYKQVIAGKNYACGLWTNGEIYCWGRGDHGQLGNALLQNRLDPQMVRPEPGRILVPGSGVFASFDASGADHVCGLSFNRVVFCWGNGAKGQLGSGEWLTTVPYPLLMTQP